MNRDIILVGDSSGVRDLLTIIPPSRVCAIIAASIRPSYIEDLSILSSSLGCSFFIQPKLNDIFYSKFVTDISNLRSQFLFCNSYSMKIHSDVLELFQGNAYNIHYSLLPQNRGPNPENWALIHGHTVTGVTLHKMSNQIDKGNIIFQNQVPIAFEDTWVTLLSKLHLTAITTIIPQIKSILNQDFSEDAQKNLDSISNKRLNHDSPKICFRTMSNLEIYNLIRAQVFPLRGAYVEVDNSRIYYNYFILFEQVSDLRLTFSI